MSESITILKSVTFDYGVIELRSDDILTYTPSRHLKTFSLDLVKESLKVFLEITEEKPKLYYCDIRHFSKDTDSETKALIKSTLHLYATHCAIIEKSTLIAYLIHIFSYLYKPETPIKMFKNINDAVNWLKSQ